MTIALLFTLTASSSACNDTSIREARAQGLGGSESQSPTAACFLRAEDATSLLDADVFDLCRGAPSSTGPIQCFLAADERLDLLDDQAVRLCQCADSIEPVACWESVDDESNISDEQIERLCAPRLAFGLLANCRAVGEDS